MSFSSTPTQPSIATVLELMSGHLEIIQDQQKVNQLTGTRLAALSNTVRAVGNVGKAMSDVLTLALEEIATVRAEGFLMNAVVANLVAKAEPVEKTAFSPCLTILIPTCFPHPVNP